MHKRDDWLTFCITLLVIAIGYFLLDRATVNRFVSNIAWRLDFWTVISSVLFVAGVYTLLSVVHHIIHVRDE